MAKNSLIQLVYLLLICGLIHLCDAGDEFDCENASYDLFQCRNYIIGNGFRMFEYCCSGLKNLNETIRTKADRVGSCKCLKREFSDFNEEDEKRAANLENLCKVKLPFRFARNVDCLSVNATVANSSTENPAVVGGGGSEEHTFVGLQIMLLFFYFIVL